MRITGHCAAPTDGQDTRPHTAPLPPCTHPAPTRSAHPPPWIDVGNIHEGVVFLQWFILVENLYLDEETEDTMNPGQVQGSTHLAMRLKARGGR